MSEEYQVVQYTKELERRLYNIKDYKQRPRLTCKDPSGGGEAVIYDDDPYTTNSRITVINRTGTEIPPNRLLKIGDPIDVSTIGADMFDNDNVIYSVSYPAYGEKCNVCVNFDALPDGEAGFAAVSGIIHVKNSSESSFTPSPSEDGMTYVIPVSNGMIGQDAGYEPYIPLVYYSTDLKIGCVNLGGGSSSASKETGTFDVQFATREADGETATVVRCFDSGNPSSQYAGVLYAGNLRIDIPVVEFEQAAGYVFLDVTVNSSDEIVAELKFERDLPAGGDQRYVKAIAQVIGTGGWRISRRCPVGDVEVVGRWV